MNDSNMNASNSNNGNSSKIFVDVEDIEIMTGRSKRQCYRYIEQIKDYFDKKPHQRITLKEVSKYFGVE